MTMDRRSIGPTLNIISLCIQISKMNCLLLQMKLFSFVACLWINCLSRAILRQHFMNKYSILFIGQHYDFISLNVRLQGFLILGYY